MTGAVERVPKKTWVLEQKFKGPYEAMYAKVNADRTWQTVEVPSGHLPMMDMPEQFADMLERAT